MTGKSSLIFVIGFGLIMGYISLNLHEGGKQADSNSALYYETTMLHNIAVAGAHMGLAKVFQDTAWGLNGAKIEHELSGGTIPASYSVERVPATGSGGTMIRSIARYRVPGYSGDPLETTIEVYLARQQLQSFAMYAWMTNSENINGTPINWITGDLVDGRVHTNGRINVNGFPNFMGLVTTVNGFNFTPGTGTNRGTYQQGWESGVDSIKFPRDLSALVTASQDVANGGRYFDSTSIWVTLSGGNSSVRGDGTALVRFSSAGPVVDTVVLNSTFNGLILGRDSVHVRGVLDGRLTVASLHDIFIEDNITYEQDPRVVPTSTDMLGLVAERRILVVDNPANSTDCTIHASIFSRDSSFIVENSNSGPPRGILSVLGSVIQNTRGPFGTFSSGILMTGFSKQLVYDRRLENPTVRPPFFPGFFPPTLPIVSWWESPVNAIKVEEHHHEH